MSVTRRPTGPRPGTYGGRVSTSRDPLAPFRPVRAATTLGVWAAARQAGADADSVLEAIAGVGGRIRAATPTVAERTGLPGAGENLAGPMELLTLLRAGGRPSLLLPRAGDVRGLPVNGDVVSPGLSQGAVVVLPALDLGLVQVDGHWRAHDCDAPFHPALPYDQARTELDEAVGAATAILTRAELDRDATGARSSIASLMIAERVDLPAGLPPRVGTLLATAISVDALLRVSSAHDPLAAGSGGLALLDTALRPLADAVREARRTAVDVAVTALLR